MRGGGAGKRGVKRFLEGEDQDPVEPCLEKKENLVQGEEINNENEDAAMNYGSSNGDEEEPYLESSRRHPTPNTETKDNSDHPGVNEIINQCNSCSLKYRRPAITIEIPTVIEDLSNINILTNTKESPRSR